MSWNPDGFPGVRLGNRAEWRKIMRKQSLFVALAAVLVGSSVASAQDQPSQDKTNAPTALQSTTPDKPPVATVPEAATDVAGVPPGGGDTGKDAQRYHKKAPGK